MSLWDDFLIDSKTAGAVVTSIWFPCQDTFSPVFVEVKDFQEVWLQSYAERRNGLEKGRATLWYREPKLKCKKASPGP